MTEITHPRPVPLLHEGLLLTGQPAGTPLEAWVNGETVAAEGAQLTLAPWLGRELRIELSRNGSPLPGSPLRLRRGGWQGRVTGVSGLVVRGLACDLEQPERDVAVVAWGPEGILAFATARADADGAFTLISPASLSETARRTMVRVGIVGSDCLLEGGLFPAGGMTGRSPALRVSAPERPPLSIRIKISCPTLKDAPAWGDYHFANSLRKSFEKIGMRASVDCQDSWYDRPDDEDVTIVLRGRHRYKTDPAKLNIMWLISHPDRIPFDEYADYDHVGVASDIYCAELRSRGVSQAAPLHQATDAELFGADFPPERKQACLFVGNSRREYRTMVHWCLERHLPLELYGGGWEDVAPDELVRAQNIPNAELPGYYAGHLLLLNDHWDSMRDNGFLSNRLFDGSAAGAPILTDRVLGLSEIFGDTIATASTVEEFEAQVRDALANPDAWIARAAEARAIVLGGHTFDHRARELAKVIASSLKSAMASPFQKPTDSMSGQARGTHV